jgi:hypothetical protein
VHFDPICTKSNHACCGDRRDSACTQTRANLTALSERIRRAEQRVDRERDQYRAAQTQTAISIGSTVLGALFGRRSRSSATTAMRGVGRAAQQKADVDRALEDVVSLQAQLQDLESDLREHLARVAGEYDRLDTDVEELAIAPRKSDITVDRVALVWVPCSADPNGRIHDAID